MLILSTPTPHHCLDDPAQAIANGQDPIFGYTIPHYNGNSLLDRNPHTMGVSAHISLEPCRVGYYSDGVAGLFDIPRQNAKFGVVTAATHHFSWAIHLPKIPRNGNPFWEGYGRMSNLRNFLTKSFQSGLLGFSGLAGRNFNDLSSNNFNGVIDNACRYGGPCRVRLYPEPSHRVFENHCRFHEEQHVMDHAWIARELFGPIDAWQEGLAKDVNVVAADNKLSFEGIPFPTSYADPPSRILDYYQNMIGKSGDLFHETSKGKPPKFKVKKFNYENGEWILDLAIEAQDLIKHSPLTKNEKNPHHLSIPDIKTHAHERGACFQLKTDIITGAGGADYLSLQTCSIQSYRPRTVKPTLNKKTRDFLSVHDATTTQEEEESSFHLFD